MNTDNMIIEQQLSNQKQAAIRNQKQAMISSGSCDIIMLKIQLFITGINYI